MVTYAGMDATEFAERHGMGLNKYSDPIEDALTEAVSIVTGQEE